jgi:hypothetical protein
MFKKLFFILMAITIFLVSCANSPEVDNAETTSFSTTYAALVAALRTNGATVETLSPISQPFFEPEGQVIKIDGQEVQVFEFAEGNAASLAATTISSNGDSIGTTTLSWLATPHFFKSGNIIVLYVGDVNTVVMSLEAVLGSQIAGG